jgi:hypothetical protein
MASPPPLQVIVKQVPSGKKSTITIAPFVYVSGLRDAISAQVCHPCCSGTCEILRADSICLILWLHICDRRNPTLLPPVGVQRVIPFSPSILSSD